VSAGNTSLLSPAGNTCAFMSFPGKKQRNHTIMNNVYVIDIFLKANCFFIRL